MNHDALCKSHGVDDLDRYRDAGLLILRSTELCRSRLNGFANKIYPEATPVCRAELRDALLHLLRT